MMERVDVTILGREYSLVCAAAERDALLAAVRHADRLMSNIQASGKISGNERIAVMAAIAVAGELLTLKAPDGPLGGLAIGDFKRKMEDMHTMIDSVLDVQV